MATHSPRQKGRPPHKEKICEICGDVGFQKAIITCYQCKNVDVHEYCMVGCYEDAPDDWSCEQCVRVIENKYSVESRLHSSIKICQNTVPPKKRIKFRGGDDINWEKEVQTRKTKYIPVKESLNLLNGVSSRVVPTKSLKIETRRNSSKPKTQPRSFSKSRTIESSKKQVSSSSKDCLLGTDGSNIPELRSPNAVKTSGMMNPLMTHPCDPALAHSWKGSFDIFNAPEIVPKMLNNCIQAHPPSRVRRKVYEFSRLLPDTLKFQLVSRGKIWENLFNNNIPGKEDVGLYFFTSDKERYGIYNSLVEFIRSNDLVMKMVINDVELLILASTVLRNDSQKLSCTLWNKKHFLWGLFYQKGQDTDGCAEGGSNKV